MRFRLRRAGAIKGQMDLFSRACGNTKGELGFLNGGNNFWVEWPGRRLAQMPQIATLMGDFGQKILMMK
jgi:hypothetical protein